MVVKTITERILQFLQYPLFIVGCLVSTIIRLLFPGIRYGNDVTTFVEVGSYADHFNELYASDLFSNYPIVGLLASTGLLKFFDFDIGNYMIALSILDMLNVFLVFFILKMKSSELHSRY